MAMDLRAAAKRRWREAILLGSTAVLFAVKGLFSFLTVEDLAGRDLVSNFAFTWLMRQNLLHGEIFRWTNRWLLGFPSFDLYPPLFFVLTAAADLATGGAAGLRAWFTAVVFLSVLLVPVAVYLALRSTFGRDEAFFAGFYALYFLFVYPPLAQAYQVFSVGLVAQGLAFLLLFPAVGFALRGGRRDLIIGGVLLGLTGLAHPFVAVGGFAAVGVRTALTRDPEHALPAAVGGLLMLPWLARAAPLLPYVDTYTFAPANTGTFLYLLLPLVLLGGYRGTERRSLLGAFALLLVMGVVELPLVSQELRFYTYALGFGSVLAGMGAHRALRLLDDLPRAAVGAALLLPVVGLSLHAGLPQTWAFAGDAGPLYDRMDGMEEGRVLVETANGSIHDSYVLQANLPMRTGHRGVNELHLDAATPANYILTLEAWVSSDPLYNPICRTCGSGAEPALVERRLDDLGVRYVVARTRAARDRLDGFLASRGRHGDYWLFENTRGHDLVEPLDRRPVALRGSYEDWVAVNDLMFVRNVSRPVAWVRGDPGAGYAAVIDMRDAAPAEALARLEDVDPAAVPGTNVSAAVTGDAVTVSADGPVRVKIGWTPRLPDAARAGRFNTVVLPRGGDLRIG